MQVIEESDIRLVDSAVMHRIGDMIVAGFREGIEREIDNPAVKRAVVRLYRNAMRPMWKIEHFAKHGGNKRIRAKWQKRLDALHAMGYIVGSPRR